MTSCLRERRCIPAWLAFRPVNLELFVPFITKEEGHEVVTEAGILLAAIVILSMLLRACAQQPAPQPTAAPAQPTTAPPSRPRRRLSH